MSLTAIIPPPEQREPTVTGPCQVLGIVNVTRDSFSDGGRFLHSEDAIAHARSLTDAGAAMIDLGPASSHPDAETVSPQEEIARLTPIVSVLCAEGIDFSVDSFHPETHRWAIEAGVKALNDIQGFPHREHYDTLARAPCNLIVMHSIQRLGKATRATSDPARIWDAIVDFFDERVEALVRAGVGEERLILDPGMGFFLGRDPECSLMVLRRIPQLRRRYGLPVLISVSRKSFLRTIAGCSLDAAGAPTLAAELFAAEQNVDWIRTHDVCGLIAAMKLRTALETPPR